MNEVVDHFKSVLLTRQSKSVENAGFITINSDSGTVIKTYTQKKIGFSYFYGKRKVLDDGVSTTHLDI